MEKRDSPKKLVLVGAGHAHLTALSLLETFLKNGHEVTVISASNFHYYSGMGPGMLSGIYRPQELRFNIEKLVHSKGGRFVSDKVIRIDPTSRTLFLKNNREIRYDIASFNTGSEVPLFWSIPSNSNIYKVKPIEELFHARCRITDELGKGTLQLAVIGGGAAGVEISSNLWRLIRDHHGTAEINLVSREPILNRFDPRVRDLVLKKLDQKKIVISENVSVSNLDKSAIILEGGKRIPYHFAFLATGVRPSSLFKDSGIPTGEDGGLTVNEYLQSITYPEIFGGGDCIHFMQNPLDKVGVHAVRQNHVLLHNLCSALNGGALKPFSPQKNYLLILNMGDGTGIFFRKSCVWDGKMAFTLKNYIDNKFVKKFQLCNERDDTADHHEILK
jgi:NADH dehydrogenase FAD-containing subunit